MKIMKKKTLHIPWDFDTIAADFISLSMPIFNQQTYKTLCGKRVKPVSISVYIGKATCDVCANVASEESKCL